jgi:purine-binding chemotaxis protein CheW
MAQSNISSNGGPQSAGQNKAQKNQLPEPAAESGQFNFQNDVSLSSEELADVWARRAYELAKEPAAEVTGDTVHLLVFRLNGERYGIDVANVREIYPRQQLTSVPRTPDFSAGVFSARGRILSVIDLRAFLGLPSQNQENNHPATEAKIIIVTNAGSTTGTAQIEVGILADEVADVVTIFNEDIEPPLTTHSGIHIEYLQGVTSSLITILNLNALLGDKRLIIQEDMV